MRYRPVPLPGLPRFSGGAVGYLGYDLVREFEKLPARARDDLGLPEVVLLLADRLLVFDNVTQKIQIIANLFLQEGMDPRAVYDAGVAGIEEWLSRLRRAASRSGREPSSPAAPSDGALRSNLSQAEYEAMVRRAKEYIHAGDVIQVVLAQRFEGELARRSVRRLPQPALDQSLSVSLLPRSRRRLAGRGVARGDGARRGRRGHGATRSPERVRAARWSETTSRSNASCSTTRRRSPSTSCSSISAATTSAASPRSARCGVTERLVVERYSHVMHIVSNVRGRLAPDDDAFDAFRATFPAGTLSGAPKVRAMQIIEELEPVRRGVYGGAVGYFDFSGNMDTGIAIRTVLIKNGRVYVQAGAGIVADSVPEREHLECLNKARGMFQALRTAEELASR